MKNLSLITKQKNSQALYARAQQHIPGGVNSPVRSFYGVNGTPIVMQRGDGAYLYDVDGNEYIDFLCSWGPLILGHAHPKVTAAVKAATAKGLSFGTVTEIEVQMAEKICALMPNIERVRMVNSGTEATMSAIRLARGYKGRDKIIKFTGCYHGHNDALLVNAGSGALTLGVPSSLGVPADLAQHTLVADFNDLDSVVALFSKHSQQIACVIVEPIAANMNLIPAHPEFLQGLRQLCDQYQALLIFDEVMTGFRVAEGGAQQMYAVTPDLTTLGKIIGGGLPVGAFGGRSDIMQMLAPLGPVYQAGTLSGNPLAMAAGLATLETLSQPGFYQRLQQLTQHLLSGLEQLAKVYHIPFTSNAVCGMFGFFFTACEHVTNYQQATDCDIKRFQRFFHGMLQAGIYLAPSVFESNFISSAHNSALIDKTLNAAEHVFKKLA